MLIVWWRITIMFRTCQQMSKPQANYHCCLRFSFRMPYWLFPRNTITFHKYFWCSWFCDFHSKGNVSHTYFLFYRQRCMSVIESSANHPSLLEMVGTLSSYLLIVVRRQHAVQWIVNKFNMTYGFQVYWVSRHQIIASSRLEKIIRCCAVCSHDSFKV